MLHRILASMMTSRQQEMPFLITKNHPSILKIREKHAIKDDDFDFKSVSEELIDKKLRSIYDIYE